MLRTVSFALAQLDALLLVGDGCHAVVVRQLVDAEQLRLQAVPAARQLVAVPDGFDQRLDGLVGGLVGEVAAGQPVRVVAQPVLDHLVGEQGVEHVRARPQARLERVRDALGGVAADVAVGREQARERDLERHGVGVVLELDRDRRRLLLEQPRPRRAAGERLLGEDLLLGLGEQVRAVAAGRAQVMAREVEPFGGDQLLGPLVLEPGPLELEEQQAGLDAGRALLELLEQGAARRVGGVAGEVQDRVGAGAAEQLLDRLQLVHGGDHPGPVELGDLARVGLGEGVGAPLDLGEDLADGGVGVVGPAVEQRVEVPGDRLELRIFGDFGRAHDGQSNVAEGERVSDRLAGETVIREEFRRRPARGGRRA